MAAETLPPNRLDERRSAPSWTSEVAVLVLVGCVFGLIGHLLSGGLTWGLLVWPALGLTASGALSLFSAPPTTQEERPASPD